MSLSKQRSGVTQMLSGRRFHCKGGVVAISDATLLGPTMFVLQSRYRSHTRKNAYHAHPMDNVVASSPLHEPSIFGRLDQFPVPARSTHGVDQSRSSLSGHPAGFVHNASLDWVHVRSHYPQLRFGRRTLVWNLELGTSRASWKPRSIRGGHCPSGLRSQTTRMGSCPMRPRMRQRGSR